MSDNDVEKRAQGRLGTVLGEKYRLDALLGVGGMAVVFAATHRNQKRVAIKMLHSELSVNEQVRTRFLREGYAANTVDHAGAVAVLDDDTAEDGAAYLVMERLEGDDVDRLWEKSGRRLSPDIVLALASQLLDVLAAAHAKSIIHRDIKPSNLFITRDGTVKVLDFGIARVRDEASGGARATSTGVMLGTPSYMAPEQALGKSKQIDGTTDVWSVGATLFTLLSGQFVHEGESATEVVVLVATQPARSLATVAPHIDPRIALLVDRALAYHRTDRWPSAAAMRDAVRETYLAVFGDKPTKEPLQSLFAASPMEMASTAYALTVPPLSVVPLPTGTPLPTAAPTPVALPSAQGMTPWPHPGSAPPSFPDRGSSSSPRLPPTTPLEVQRVGTPMPPTPVPSGVSPTPHLPATTARPVVSESYSSPAALSSKPKNTKVLVVIAVLGLAFGVGAVRTIVAPQWRSWKNSAPASPSNSHDIQVAALGVPDPSGAPPPATQPPDLSAGALPSPPAPPPKEASHNTLPQQGLPASTHAVSQAPDADRPLSGGETAPGAPAAPSAGAKLVVAKAGDGDGSITSDPAGVDCGATCVVEISPGTRVHLTATPAVGAVFVGWSGACQGTGVCELSPDTATQVTASFGRSAAVVVVPAPMCKGQCADASRTCKSRCKSEFRGRERRQCQSLCDTTEHDCKAAATCP
jgi:serine/threonine protein kinase